MVVIEQGIEIVKLYKTDFEEKHPDYDLYRYAVTHYDKQGKVCPYFSVSETPKEAKKELLRYKKEYPVNDFLY